MRVFRFASHASHPTASWSRGRFARLFFIVATHNWFFLPTERREEKTLMRCLKPGPECFYSRWRSPVVDRTHADQDTAVPNRTTADQGTTAFLPCTIQSPTAIQVQEDITTVLHHTIQNPMCILGRVSNTEVHTRFEAA